MIVTPGSELRAEYVAALTGTFIALAERGQTYNWVNGQSSLVHHAREVAASAGELNADDEVPFGGHEYGSMLWIDSDISWKPEDALRLLDSPYEVTTGVYLLADGITTSVHAWGKPGESIPPAEIVQMTGPVKVQSCGFGFIAAKKGVFERMARPWFAHLAQPVLRADGTAIIDSLGEDISWCVRAYQAGIEVWLDPAVRPLHWKTLPVGFAAYG